MNIRCITMWSKTNPCILQCLNSSQATKPIPPVCNVLTLAKLLVVLTFHISTTMFLISSNLFEKLTPSSNRYTHNIMLHVGFINKDNTIRTMYSICTKPTLVRQLLRLKYTSRPILHHRPREVLFAKYIL